MSLFELTTPVALIVYNRPAVTARVFEAIRDARPSRLLIIADGPKPGRPDDALKCAEVRRIVEQVNWPCEFECNFSDVNLGCRERVASGLDWVFHHVEEAIIIEDDCLPHPSFFRFCQEMLTHYRDDERVMTVCGSNLAHRWKDNEQSYHFSYYDWAWGWASWRRAWLHYDVTMEKWRLSSSKEFIRGLLADKRYYSLRAGAFDQALQKKVDTWDYQWAFARMLHRGLAIIPSVNMVSNIGFGIDATHTKVLDTKMAELPAIEMEFPVDHPKAVLPDMEYDLAVVAMIEGSNTFIARVLRVFVLWRVMFGKYLTGMLCDRGI